MSSQKPEQDQPEVQTEPEVAQEVAPEGGDTVEEIEGLPPTPAGYRLAWAQADLNPPAPASAQEEEEEEEEGSVPTPAPAVAPVVASAGDIPSANPRAREVQTFVVDSDLPSREGLTQADLDTLLARRML